MVTVWIGLKCSWFDYTFVVDQLILIGLLLHLNGVILGLSHNIIRFAYGSLTSFGQRMLNVIQNVLSEYGTVQVFAAFAVERDNADFAFLITSTGLVAIILGTP